MEEKETRVTVRETAGVGFTIPPEVVLENARAAARTLSDVISKKKKPVIMNGEIYLEFEDWQTVGQFYGYTVQTGDAVFVEIDGVKGAKAHADLIDLKTGQVIGGAEAYCMRDEEKWYARPKYEWVDGVRAKTGDEPVPWFQLASMAQTRAGAKAFRNRLAWVVVLAGYRPTPSEEMIDSTVTTADHWCPLHKVAFFKTAKMTAFAHPIEGTKIWCYEQKNKEPDKVPNVETRADVKEDQEVPSATSGGEPEAASTNPATIYNEPKAEQKTSDAKLGINMMELQELAQKCHKTVTDMVKWSSGTFKISLKISKNFEGLISQLTQEQKDALMKYLRDLAEVA